MDTARGNLAGFRRAYGGDTNLPNSNDVSPLGRRDEAPQVAHVRRRDDDFDTEREGLRREDHVAVERVGVGRRRTPATGLGPQLGRTPHGDRGEREVFEGLPEGVEPGQARDFARKSSRRTS